MPEGDSVYRVAKRLREALEGRILTTAELRVPAHATAELTGSRVLEVVPRGKHLLMRFDSGLTLHTHLRMDGRWRVLPAGRRWASDTDWQIRAILGNAECVAVGYNLPVVELLPTEAEGRAVGHLGPDLLGPDWDAEEALRRLGARPERPLMLALLDQGNLAGIGNVYANELSFLTRASPWTPIGEVPDAALARTVGLAHKLLTLNRLREGHITTGETRIDRRHWVYGRARQPCRRCGTRISTSMIGPEPQSRVVYWCTSCQKGPTS